MNTKNVKANAEKKSQETTKSTTKKATTEKPVTKSEVTAPDSKSVKGMLTTLKALSEKITDKNLKAEVMNSLKVKNPKAEDIAALLKRVIDSGKPVVANEEKPAPKKTTKTGKSSDSEKETDEKSKPAPKKKVTAKTTEKPEKEKPAVATVKTTGDISAPMATIFPDSITTKIDGEEVKLTLAKGTEYTTVEGIVEAMESKIVVLACYWTARHIKEFNYSYALKVKAPKSFKDDLDLTIAVVDCPNAKRLWTMSLETEGMYFFEEEDLTPIEDTNPYNGEKYSVRVSNGMEFAIYTADATQE